MFIISSLQNRIVIYLNSVAILVDFLYSPSTRSRPAFGAFLSKWNAYGERWGYVPVEVPGRDCLSSESGESGVVRTMPGVTVGAERPMHTRRNNELAHRDFQILDALNALVLLSTGQCLRILGYSPRSLTYLQGQLKRLSTPDFAYCKQTASLPRRLWR